MKRTKSLKLWISLVAVVILLGAALAAAPTLARYIRGANDIKNDFASEDSVNPKVNASYFLNKDDKMVLQDVSFNVGKTEYPVFVRVKVLVRWKSVTTGDILYLVPERGSVVNPGTWEDVKDEDGEVVLDENGNPVQRLVGRETAGDYTISFTQNTDWYYDNDDGYWYFTTRGVASGKDTPDLVVYFEQFEDEPKPVFKDKYVMDVEFIVQTVQAVGHTDDDAKRAWQDAWKSFVRDEHDAGGEGGSTQEP